MLQELPGSEEKIPRLKVASNPNSVESSSEGSNHPTVTKLPKYAFHVVKKYRVSFFPFFKVFVVSADILNGMDFKDYSLLS